MRQHKVFNIKSYFRLKSFEKNLIGKTYVTYDNMNKSNKAILRDLIAATGLVILLKNGFKSSIWQPVWPWNLMNDLEKQ